MKSRSNLCFAVGAIALVAASTVRAAEGQRTPLSWHADGPDASKPDDRSDEAAKRNRALEIPQTAYTFSAFGARAMSAGVAGVGGAYGPLSSSEGSAQGIGGLRIWGSPLDRLTLLAEFERRLARDEAAPSAGVLVRLLGDHESGGALAVLGRYKAEGFGELEGEIEGGVAGSLVQGSLYVDTNAVFGTAMEEKEVDGEWLLRAGVEPMSRLRVGVDGRLRYRFAGDKELAGGRTWDAVGGPQVLVVFGQFFGSVTAGPTTVGIADGIGWSVFAMAGGAAP